MFIDFRVDSGTPDGGLVFWEYILDMLDSLLTGNDGSYMDLGGMAFGKHCLIAQFHAASGSQHRVGDNQSLIVDAGRSDIFYMYIKFQCVLILAVGRHKCVLGFVEVAQETLMERQTCTQEC